MNPPILRPIKGFCPMPDCDGMTLAMETDGTIVCTNPVCARPRAVHELLNDVSRFHEVALTDYDFSIKHPLYERIDDALFECTLHEALSALRYAPQPPGRYAVTVEPDGSPGRWEPL